MYRPTSKTTEWLVRWLHTGKWKRVPALHFQASGLWFYFCFTSEDFQSSAEKMIFQQQLSICLFWVGETASFERICFAQRKDYGSETQTTCWTVAGVFFMQHSPLLVTIILIGDPWSPDSRLHSQAKAATAVTMLKDKERRGQRFHPWSGPSNQQCSLYNFFIKEAIASKFRFCLLGSFIHLVSV